MANHKREEGIKVILSEEDTMALLSMLNVISEESIDPKQEKAAAKIRDAIIQHRRPCSLKTGKAFVIYFYKTEVALLIKYFAMTVQIIMHP